MLMTPFLALGLLATCGTVLEKRPRPPASGESPSDVTQCPSPQSVLTFTARSCSAASVVDAELSLTSLLGWKAVTVVLTAGWGRSTLPRVSLLTLERVSSSQTVLSLYGGLACMPRSLSERVARDGTGEGEGGDTGISGNTGGARGRFVGIRGGAVTGITSPIAVGVGDGDVCCLYRG